MYFMPLAIELDDEDKEELMPFAVSRLRRGARMGLLVDADASPDFAAAVLHALRRGDIIHTKHGGTVRFVPSPSEVTALVS